MTTCIMLSGRAGTGKSTTAEILAKLIAAKDKTFARVSFAKPIKAIATEQFGWDGQKDAKGRRLLQELGRVGREYEPDIWPRLAFTRYYPGDEDTDYAIVDDWRFPNEGKWVEKNMHFRVVKVRISAPAREILKGTHLYDDITEISLPSERDHDGLYDILFGNPVGFGMDDLRAGVRSHLLPYIEAAEARVPTPEPNEVPDWLEGVPLG